MSLIIESYLFNIQCIFQCIINAYFEYNKNIIYI